MLSALVAVETIVLALLAIVVVALLRSHAEVLRRLPAIDEDEREPARLEPIALGTREPELPAHLPGPRGRASVAHDVAGTTLGGDGVVISMSSGVDTVIAFLSSGCATCRTFWDGLQPSERRPLPGGARVVVVVKDREVESPSKLRDLAPSDVPVVHSSQAWDDFQIGMSPYFCFVDGRTGEVRSEGAAMTWEQVASLLRDSLMDEELARREA